VDLLDFFRDVRPWGQFWRLLSQLGSDSRYAKAQIDDPEVAQMLAEEENEKRKAGEVPEKWRPRPADFTLLHEMMAQQIDLLSDIVVITGRGLPSNGTRKFADRFPRPENELVKARKAVEDREDARYLEQMDEVFVAAKVRWRAQQDAQASEVADALSEGS
jgi:hypothetical protein